MTNIISSDVLIKEFNLGYKKGQENERERILKIICKWINNNVKIDTDVNKIENEVLEDLKKEINKNEW